MKIDPEDKIANISIMKVRDFLRYVDTQEDWDKNVVSNYLEISPGKAYDLLKALFALVSGK